MDEMRKHILENIDEIKVLMVNKKLYSFPFTTSVMMVCYVYMCHFGYE